MPISPFKAAPVKALRDLDQFTRHASEVTLLSEAWLQLIETRVSQINGCAFCIDLHVKAALDAGEDPQRLHALPAWRGSSLFEEPLRMALDWAEALTGMDHATIEASRVSVSQHFSDEDLVRLTYAVGAINLWNRVASAFQVDHPRGMLARIGGRG